MTDDWYLSKLELMKGRYQMFIGSGDVTHLKAFLDGYMEHRSDVGLERISNSENDFVQAFTYWVAIKGRESVTSGWADIILSKLTLEEDSIKSFFLLLDEFKAIYPEQSVEDLKVNYNAMIQSF